MILEIFFLAWVYSQTIFLFSSRNVPFYWHNNIQSMYFLCLHKFHTKLKNSHQEKTIFFWRWSSAWEIRVCSCYSSNKGRWQKIKCSQKKDRWIRGKCRGAWNLSQFSPRYLEATTNASPACCDVILPK